MQFEKKSLLKIVLVMHPQLDLAALREVLLEVGQVVLAEVEVEAVPEGAEVDLPREVVAPTVFPEAVAPAVAVVVAAADREN